MCIFHLCLFLHWQNSMCSCLLRRHRHVDSPSHLWTDFHWDIADKVAMLLWNFSKGSNPPHLKAKNDWSTLCWKYFTFTVFIRSPCVARGRFNLVNVNSNTDGNIMSEILLCLGSITCKVPCEIDWDSWNQYLVSSLLLLPAYSRLRPPWGVL